MQRVHICAETDSTAPKKTERMAGYLLDCPERADMEPRYRFYKTQESYHVAIIESLTEALSRMKCACEIHIHSKNTFVLGMLQNNLEAWAGHEFCTSKGEPVKNQDKWIQLWKALNHHKHLLVVEPEDCSYYGWMQEQMEKGESASE